MQPDHLHLSRLFLTGRIEMGRERKKWFPGFYSLKFISLLQNIYFSLLAGSDSPKLRARVESPITVLPRCPCTTYMPSYSWSIITWNRTPFPASWLSEFKGFCSPYPHSFVKEYIAAYIWTFYSNFMQIIFSSSLLRTSSSSVDP